MSVRPSVLGKCSSKIFSLYGLGSAAIFGASLFRSLRHQISPTTRYGKMDFGGRGFAIQIFNCQDNIAVILDVCLLHGSISLSLSLSCQFMVLLRLLLPASCLFCDPLPLPNPLKRRKSRRGTTEGHSLARSRSFCPSLRCLLFPPVIR